MRLVAPRHLVLLPPRTLYQVRKLPLPLLARLATVVSSARGEGPSWLPHRAPLHEVRGRPALLFPLQRPLLRRMPHPLSHRAHAEVPSHRESRRPCTTTGPGR